MTDDDLQYLRVYVGGVAKKAGVAIAVDRVEDGFGVTYPSGASRRTHSSKWVNREQAVAFLRGQLKHFL